MPEEPRSRPAERADYEHEARTRSHDGDGMEQLRELLLGQEISRIDRIQERVEDREIRTRDVSQVLPEAIFLRREKDPELTRALTPNIEEGIRDSVRRHPETIADALFPVIGPALRKSIAETFGRLLQSFNQTLEHSLSPQSIKWRFEARRTGKSFAEVVLLHTLIYRVEQVFLICRESGILLQHVFDETVIVRDGDVISGMLTAIQDFARDSFAVPDEDTLDALQVGDLGVWVERGPKAVLAAVFRGNPPRDYRTSLKQALERIHLEHADTLESFDGDTTSFATTETHLETCLVRAERETAGGGKPGFALAVVGLLMTVVALWSFFSIRGSLRWARYLEYLDAEPGIVVVSSRKQGGTSFLSGLRDPFAADPTQFLEKARLDPGVVEAKWEPYSSTEPRIVEARVRDTVRPPATVALDFEDGIVSVSGTAFSEWAEGRLQAALMIPGVSGLDDDRLVVTDRAADILEEARRRLQIPETVKLDLVDSELQARGDAAQSWIDEARLLARTIPGVTGFRHDQLRVVRDGSRALLVRCREILRPPESVRLRVEDRTLVVAGSAPQEWIAQSRLLARLIPGVEEYEDDELISTDTDALLLDSAKLTLRPPNSLRLEVEDGVLVASGIAPRRWIEDFRRFGPMVPGISALREENLQDADAIRFDESRMRIETQIFYFGQNSTVLVPEDTELVGRVAASIRELLEVAEKLGIRVKVEVVGHSEDSSRPVSTLKLSMARARAVMKALTSRDLDGRKLTVKGAGATMPLERKAVMDEGASNRRVTFKVLLLDDQEGGERIDR